MNEEYCIRYNEISSWGFQLHHCNTMSQTIIQNIFWKWSLHFLHISPHVNFSSHCRRFLRISTPPLPLILIAAPRATAATADCTAAAIADVSSVFSSIALRAGCGRLSRRAAGLVVQLRQLMFYIFIEPSVFISFSLRRWARLRFSHFIRFLRDTALLQLDSFHCSHFSRMLHTFSAFQQQLSPLRQPVATAISSRRRDAVFHFSACCAICHWR